MNDTKFNYLIPEFTKKLKDAFFEGLKDCACFANGTIDTSPLLNMMSSVFISAHIQTLDAIKKRTIGDIQLIENIELIEKKLTELFDDLPFIQKVEWFK